MADLDGQPFAVVPRRPGLRVVQGLSQGDDGNGDWRPGVRPEVIRVEQFRV